MLPKTSTRIQESIDESVNAAIKRRTESDIDKHASAGPDSIAKRLEELDREWDIERTLMTNAATLSLIGLALGAFVDRRWIALPAVVSAFLLQHGVQGWCPPVELFRRLGIRTAQEIEYERYMLKSRRGDFGARGAKTSGTIFERPEYQA
jgi:hypothetical protein